MPTHDERVQALSARLAAEFAARPSVVILAAGDPDPDPVVSGVLYVRMVGSGVTDTTPPTTPGTPTATATATDSLTVSWVASTDNVAVTGYQVYVNDVLTSTVSTSEVVLTGLTGSTTYTVKVRATDAAGNFSAYSTADLTTNAVGGSAQHSIWASVPSVLTPYNDAGPAWKFGTAFYRIGATTDGWRCVGGRFYIPAGSTATLVSPLTLSLYSSAYDTFPNVSVAGIQSKTFVPHDGANDVYWDTPYAFDSALNEMLWIVVQFSDAHYFVGDFAGTNSIKASDGSEVYVVGEGESRSFYYNGSSNSDSGSSWWGSDIIVDEG